MLLGKPQDDYVVLQRRVIEFAMLAVTAQFRTHTAHNGTYVEWVQAPFMVLNDKGQLASRDLAKVSCISESLDPQDAITELMEYVAKQVTDGALLPKVDRSIHHIERFRTVVLPRLGAVL